ncbi:acidic fibroblast growth factor intracellular-binding protein, partial [Trichonephila clavipes]
AVVQQDGATCHTARATIDLLKNAFGDRLISRFGPVNWPPRSCDFTPLDYFLWGYVKSLVYADKPQTLDHLEDNIRRFIADIRPQMLEKVIENWTSRLDYIRASRGIHMPEIIFKMYYEFDDSVIREFLGKKLSARNRKDLDDVSDKTGVEVKSCRRQFDNVKRVYKVVEDSNCDLVDSIRSTFLLSENLARKYAAIMYLTSNRFETGKRKLQYITFDDFLFCANLMMCNWCCPKTDCSFEETSMEMDREFLQDLRDLKPVLEKETYDELKGYVLSIMKSKLPDRIYSDLDSNFKSFTRAVVNIAYGLNHSKDARDLFVDIVEKFIEPLRQSRWSDKELRSFLETYTSSASHVQFFKNDLRLMEIFLERDSRLNISVDNVGIVLTNIISMFSSRVLFVHLSKIMGISSVVLFVLLVKTED